MHIHQKNSCFLNWNAELSILLKYCTNFDPKAELSISLNYCSDSDPKEASRINLDCHEYTRGQENVRRSSNSPYSPLLLQQNDSTTRRHQMSYQFSCQCIYPQHSSTTLLARGRGLSYS